MIDLTGKTAVVFGGNGNDTVFRGKAQDLVMGDEGNDQLFGNLGNDTLSGGNGNDMVSYLDNDDGKMFGLFGFPASPPPSWQSVGSLIISCIVRRDGGNQYSCIHFVMNIPNSNVLRHQFRIVRTFFVCIISIKNCIGYFTSIVFNNLLPPRPLLASCDMIIDTNHIDKT